jgi:hypothetical protein
VGCSRFLFIYSPVWRIGEEGGGGENGRSFVVLSRSEMVVVFDLVEKEIVVVVVV